MLFFLSHYQAQFISYIPSYSWLVQTNRQHLYEIHARKKNLRARSLTTNLTLSE